MIIVAPAGGLVVAVSGTAGGAVAVEPAWPGGPRIIRITILKIA